MIAPPALGDEQRLAIDASFDGCVTIVGAAGSGKTTALVARAERARLIEPNAEPLWFARAADLGTFAARILERAGKAVTLVDDADAQGTFADACAPLFALAWEEFLAHEVDPEVPGLRSPNRFLESAFRLIRRLREARVEPPEFLSASLRGATEFYANPPNFADPALLAAVKPAYHDSLAVSPTELQRQYRREIDLAKILAKLYERYVELVAAGGQDTPRDAVDAAIGVVHADASFAANLRAAHRFAFVDDADDLTRAQWDLLGAIFGTDLPGVTLSGQLLPARGTYVELPQQHRSPPAIEVACRYLLRDQIARVENVEPRLFLHRAKTRQAEAAFVAAHVRQWLDAGTRPERVALIFRSIRHVEVYEAALLDRDIAVASAGDANVFADRRSLDALALLWNVADPFRHDAMLRTLANPAIGLSDGSLAILCSEPPNPQVPLFVLDDEPAPTARASRWDPKRDLRLGWNVVAGEQDAALSPDGRERIERFRRLRTTWISAMHERPFDEFARLVWHDGLAREGEPGSARAAAQQLVLKRLLARLSAYAGRGAPVLSVLEWARRRGTSDLETCEDADGEPGVRLLSVEAARGREFDRVVVADVRAGAFPRWYAPDAFLFSPRLGMIPKENAGDARASRTAKFSYYTARNKTRERYNDRERAALAYALRRARICALITASQPPTKGVHAPEFLEELRLAQPPGTQWLAS